MQEFNPNFFPWDEIPDSNVLPTGVFHMEGVKLEDGKSSTGKRMFGMQAKVLRPEKYAGMMFFDRYVTGTDEAPMAILPGTMGSQAMKALFKGAQIPPPGST